MGRRCRGSGRLESEAVTIGSDGRSSQAEGRGFESLTTLLLDFRTGDALIPALNRQGYRDDTVLGIVCGIEQLSAVLAQHLPVVFGLLFGPSWTL